MEDLYREEGRAELIGGKIVRLGPSGHFPSEVAGNILVSLRSHEKAGHPGKAYISKLAYVVPKLSSGRESFSPSVSFHLGPRPANPMNFIDGAPTFAVEVRDELDYTVAAEADMAAKRADYFNAGTIVVWDVDPVAEAVSIYRADAPTQSVIFRSGDVADAEPAVPGWRMAVDEMFTA
jgi:Uma2 family endonuclease